MLKYRLMSGVTLGGIVIAALFWEGIPGAVSFLALNIILLAGGLNEFFKMTEKIGLKGFTKMTIFVGLLTVFSIAIPAMIGFKLKMPFAEFLIIVFIIFGFLRVFNEEEHSKGLTRLFVSIAGLIYIGWTLSFICKIYFIEGLDMSGRYLVLYLIAVTKSSDIGAFFTGTLSHKFLPGGNHKIAPKLSPGKSWEGFFGGVAASVAVALLLHHYFGDRMAINGAPLIEVWTAVVIGAVFATLGFIGDVAESALKRASGFKDSGNTIPGMGGVLDVVDSLTLVSPLFYCYLSVVMM
jgi:phosphatidate cytidylyltransferase